MLKQVFKSFDKKVNTIHNTLVDIIMQSVFSTPWKPENTLSSFKFTAIVEEN